MSLSPSTFCGQIHALSCVLLLISDVVSDATTLLLGLEQQGLVPLSKSEVDKFLSSLRDSFEAEHQEHQDKIPSLLSPVSDDLTSLFCGHKMYWHCSFEVCLR